MGREGWDVMGVGWNMKVGRECSVTSVGLGREECEGETLVVMYEMKLMVGRHGMSDGGREVGMGCGDV